MNKFYLLSFVLIFTQVPSLTWACSCGPEPKVSEKLNTHDFVAAGTIVESKLTKANRKASRIRVVLEESEVFKGVTYRGKLEKSFKIETESDSNSCGQSFFVGQTYLVYASEAEGKLTTNLCSYNKSQFEEVEQETKQLRELVSEDRSEKKKQ